MASVLLVGEFAEGALGLYYERAFAGAGWRTARYNAWQGYARPPILSRSRPLRRMLRPILWKVMGHEVAVRAGQERPDLIVVMKGPFLGREAVRDIKRAASAPVVNIYPDNPYAQWALRSSMPAVLAEYDRVYIWGRFLLPRLEQDGVRSALYLPFAHDPADYGPFANGPAAECGRQHAIVFVGQYYPKRELWLEALAGCDVGVWGTGWSTSRLAHIQGVCVHRKAVHGPAAGTVYARARVGLNVLHASNLPGHNMRTFEIPPCRTVMVTEASEEIAGFFPPGEACLEATTPADLRRQVERALGDPNLAQSVAESGRQRGRRHTYAARVETILQDLGLPVAHRITVSAQP